MDDEAALIARRVAMAAAAWFRAPGDFEAYRLLAVAVGQWNAYGAPTMEAMVGEAELLDDLADTEPPVPLGDGVADLEDSLRRTARKLL
jgi:hypothetical protein